MADYKHPFSGRMRRLGKLGAAALGTSGRYLGDRLADALRDADGRSQAQGKRLEVAGERLAKTMGDLKGAAMKLGQLLSVDNAVLPEEMRQALSVLQRQAPAMPFDRVKALVEGHLEAPLEQHFASFEEEVLGAASLGQVHGAVLHDGRAVAVKVQYPGIADTIGSDMANLRAILKVTPIPGLKGRVDDYIEELRSAFAREADYLSEAKNLRLFSALVEELEGTVVPKPIDALCRGELLVMERLQGRLLDDAWEHLDQQERNRIGERLMLFFSTPFHRHQVLHGDPHPGNFMVLDSGELGVLDFGCVRHYDADRTDGFLRALDVVWRADDEATVQVYAELGFGHGKALVDAAVLAEFNRIMLRPFLHPGLFDFGSWDFRQEMAPFLLKNPQMLRLTPEPNDLLYLRVLSGLRGMLHAGGCQVDVHRNAHAMCLERSV